MTESETDQRSVLERLLGLVTEVRAGEGATALLLTLNVFLVLMAYYIIKPVREALILAMDSGAEYKSYMGGAIAIALLFAVPAYARVANALQRNRLVIAVTLFFASNLLLFYFGSQVEVIEKNLGLIFYLWVGVFNMMVVAQFWAFANDMYTEEQGKRLFPLVGVGASVGAAVGSITSGVIIGPLGIYQLLLVSGAVLATCAVLTQLVWRREADRVRAETEASEKASEAAETKERDGGAFAMVFRHRYLTYLAIFSLVFTFVNTNGEYMLGSLASEAAKEAAAAKGLAGDAASTVVKEQLGLFYAEFFSYVNVLGIVLQFFVVSRLVKYAGLSVTFLVLPVIALLDATAVAIVPLITILRIGKIAENATDYSVNNTVRHILWLPTTREMKYKAKQAVDTFFVRMGDVGSALLVALLAGGLGWSVRGFAVINVALIVVWLWVARLILREQKRLKSAEPQGT